MMGENVNSTVFLRKRQRFLRVCATQALNPVTGANGRAILNREASNGLHLSHPKLQFACR
jgi:hypothetical protein